MKNSSKFGLEDPTICKRRQFLKASGVLGAGLTLGNPLLWANEQAKKKEKPKTNIADALKAPRTKFSLPGLFPGKVVETHRAGAQSYNKIDGAIVDSMFDDGLQALTGERRDKSFKLLFSKDDVVGIKVNPVGAGIISTHLEVVDSVIFWLTENGLPRNQIVLWDRFDYMLKDAGFTSQRFPGVQIEGLQTMDESAAEGKSDDQSRWLLEDGRHISFNQFDTGQYYWADVDAPQDMQYLNQHVVNSKMSYFGKLLTRKLTKIINIPVFKNTGNGISMATKNLGYGAVCNTGRLHRPLFFDVCVEVLAFPAIRDKLVLNITDALTGQYDGGPGPNAQFTYDNNRLFFATDSFALDRVCHDLLLKKRKEMGVRVIEHPRYTDYFQYAEKLGLGIGHLNKIEHIVV